MQVFVAFGYEQGEDWVPDFVFPILKTLDIKILEGCEIPGKKIDVECRARIAKSDAVLGFLLRRKENPDGSWTTSEYVKREIWWGVRGNKDVIQIVEKDVPKPGGALKNLQWLHYERRYRDKFLVDLTRHLSEWAIGSVYVRLGPQALIRSLATATAQPRVCHYEILSDAHIDRTGTVPVVGLGDGLYVKLTGFRPGTHANLTIQSGGRRWSCTGVLHTQPFVTMQLT